MLNRVVALLLVVVSMLAAPAMAQVAPPPANMQFVGTITASAPDTLTIRQADGSSVPWTGPLPDFPYVVGDQITVSFTAQPGSAVQSADGLYRYTVIGPAQTGGISGSNYALTGAVDVSGPIAGGGSLNGMTLIYNAATGNYTLETRPEGYIMSTFDGPGYLYDPTSNSLSLTSTTRQPGSFCGDSGGGCFNITGSLTDGAVNRAPVWGTDGSLRGFFSVLFSGSWFVNGQQVGGVTQVPEPGSLVLFAFGLVLLGWRMNRGKRLPA